MAMTALGLGLTFTAKDLASSVVNSLGGALGKTQKDASEFGKGMTTTLGDVKEQFGAIGAKFSAVGTAINGFLSSAADNAGAFQLEIAKAGRFTNGTAEDIELLTKSAQDLDSVMMGFSFQDQAMTLAHLTNEVGNAKDAVTELVPALMLAKITGMSGAQAAGFLSDTLSGFGQDASEAEFYVDKMAFAMKKFGLTANELEPALIPTIGAAKLLGGTFEDTLTIVGIANSTLGNIKKSSVAATMAMNQLADPATALDFKKLGIEVKGVDGKFRSMLDILADVSDKTKDMTEAQKVAALSSIYNAKTAGGLNVVMDQLTKGVANSSGEMLTGAAAVAELRKQMDGAGGSATNMIEATMNTLPEQKAALQAALSSFMTTVGMPLAQALQPIVRAAVSIVTKLTGAFQALGPTIQRVLVTIVGAVGAFASMVGGVIGAGVAVGGFIAAVMALEVPLAIMAAGIAAVAILMLPITIAMGALVLASIGLKQAWDKNVGGIRDTVMDAWAKVKLAFDGMSQVFDSGKFSGSVLKELNKAENQGIKAFVVNAYVLFSRVKSFFEGVSQGFSAAIEQMRPTFTALSASVGALGDAFLKLFGGQTNPAENAEKLNTFTQAGSTLGSVLAKIVEWSAKAITWIVDLATGFMDVGTMGKTGFGVLWDSVKAVGSVFMELLTAFGQVGDALMGTSSQGKTAGESFTALAGFLAGSLAPVLQVVAMNIRGVVGMVQFMAFQFNMVRTVVSSVVEVFQEINQAIAETIDKAAALVGISSNLSGSLGIFGVGSGDPGGKVPGGPTQATSFGPSTAASAAFGGAAPQAGGATPGVAAANAAAGGGPQTSAAGIQEAIQAGFKNGGGGGGGPPITIPVMIDGEKVATILAKKDSTTQARNYNVTTQEG